MENHRAECLSDKEDSPYLWCLHCERTYKNGEYREVNSFQMCPYDGCDGDTVLDAWPWPNIRSKHPRYPEIPERDNIYSMYKKS